MENHHYLTTGPWLQVRNLLQSLPGRVDSRNGDPIRPPHGSHSACQDVPGLVRPPQARPVAGKR